MIKTLIIEDEQLAVDYLKATIKQISPEFDFIGSIDSVESAVVWFLNNPMPDLVFLDIQLSDGLSFEIFDYVKINAPIIFTTAFEEYAIKAFKVNGLDYLLKPIRIDELSKAIDKFMSFTQNDSQQQILELKGKVDLMSKMLTNQYKSRFIVNVGLHIRTIETQRVNCFYSLAKGTFLLDENGKSYDIDYSLEQLETILDPNQFFRISRQYIVNINAIKDIIAYSGRRYKLKVINSSDEDILVSRAKVNEFRVWLDR